MATGGFISDHGGSMIGGSDIKDGSRVLMGGNILLKDGIMIETEREKKCVCLSLVYMIYSRAGANVAVWITAQVEIIWYKEVTAPE